jgi:hypothetical protein
MNIRCNEMPAQREIPFDAAAAATSSQTRLSLRRFALFAVVIIIFRYSEMMRKR